MYTIHPYRKLTANISKTNTCCIFINQLRDKIGVMFGNPETTTGGNALKFYSTMRLDVRKTTQLKDGEDATGNRTRVKVVKNKMAPPFRKAEFDILFGEGISKIGEIIDLGVEFGIIKKSGSWFSYGESKIGQGRDAVKQMLLDNPELSEEIEELKSAIAQQDDKASAEELGDVLFSAVNVSRFIGVDAEQALGDACDKFISRFSQVEQLAGERGVDMKSSTLEELDALWDEAKKA